MFVGDKLNQVDRRWASDEKEKKQQREEEQEARIREAQVSTVRVVNLLEDKEAVGKWRAQCESLEKQAQVEEVNDEGDAMDQ